MRAVAEPSVGVAAGIGIGTSADVAGDKAGTDADGRINDRTPNAVVGSDEMLRDDCAARGSGTGSGTGVWLGASERVEHISLLVGALGNCVNDGVPVRDK